MAVGTTLGVAAIQGVSAASDSSSLVEDLSEKLGVSEDKVKSAFEKTRNEREAERKQELADSLSLALKDGKITQEQRLAIESKLAEVEKQRSELDKTHEDLRKYIDKQNLELDGILPGKKGSHHRGGPF